MGRALINKTKMLAEENQEMAMQLRDGPASTQVSPQAQHSTALWPCAGWSFGLYHHATSTLC